MRNTVTTLFLLMSLSPLYANTMKKIVFVQTYDSVRKVSAVRTLIDLKLEVTYQKYSLAFLVKHIKVVGYRNHKSYSGSYTPCQSGKCAVNQTTYGRDKGYVVDFYGQQLFFREDRVKR